MQSSSPSQKTGPLLPHPGARAGATVAVRGVRRWRALCACCPPSSVDAGAGHAPPPAGWEV